MPLLLLLAILATLVPACAPTRYYQRGVLAAPEMAFDSDTGVTYLRTKMEAAREGSLGGFGGATAGNCGCQ